MASSNSASSTSTTNGNAGVPAFTTTDASRVTADGTAPTLSTVTIASSNANSALATTGDTVTITLSADEAIETPTVTIGGIAIAAVGTGANWQASRVVTDQDPDGVIPFSITYADFAGNAGIPVSTTTDSSSVTVSSDAPEVVIRGRAFDVHDAGPDIGELHVPQPGNARTSAGLRLRRERYPGRQRRCPQLRRWRRHVYGRRRPVRNSATWSSVFRRAQPLMPRAIRTWQRPMSS